MNDTAPMSYSTVKDTITFIFLRVVVEAVTQKVCIIPNGIAVVVLIKREPRYRMLARNTDAVPSNSRP